MQSGKSTSQLIQDEYEKIIANPNHGVDELYRLLSDYLLRFVRPILMESGFVDEEEASDLVEDCLIKILNEGIWSFKGGDAMFATWCAVVAKNKARDYNRRRYRIAFDSIDSEENNLINELAAGMTPEQIMVETERGLQVTNTLKECINTMMNCKSKPYAIVASLFTLVLFHKFNPDTTELSSPKWAFSELEEDMVSEGATDFITEMMSWIPGMLLKWSDEFINACDEPYGNSYVGELIFGENFKTKDFENWSRRIREKTVAMMADKYDLEMEL